MSFLIDQIVYTYPILIFFFLEWKVIKLYLVPMNLLHLVEEKVC